jgi:KaiC/GvpD/RAD55 family RecA-like ATPase
MLLIFLTPFIFVHVAAAQQNPQYVILYAHGFGDSAILTAVPQSNRPPNSAVLSNGLDFRLSPVLGENLEIYGAITYNLYLRSSAPLSGTVSADLAEVRSDGTQSQVPASIVQAPVYLNVATSLVTLGVGPAINYQFQAGSSILLHVTISQTSGKGQPQLVWDNPSAATSIRLPAVSPATPMINYVGRADFGGIFQAETNGTSLVRVNATFSDAIGIYRFDSATLRFSMANGNVTELPINLTNSTDYSVSSVVASFFAEGQWQVSLLLRDSSGNNYTFSKPLVVTPFYPVAIEVFDSDGSTLSNATLSVGVDARWFWSSITNATGWGTLSLPSSDLVGPLNMTVAWSGTRSLFPLEVTRPATVSVQLTVYAANIKVTMMNLPVPLARVTVYQTGQVGQNATGIDGLAKFGRLPAGDYTITIEYLLATYQTSIHLTQSGIITVAVPFPHRTITAILAVALIAIGSVVTIRQKRGKLYPSGFSYFKELTHGGLPEACFTVIAGNSGSGKTVLLDSLAAEHLAIGNSIYIANTEYPDKVRESMMKLGVAKEEVVKDARRLICIDAYSAVGGASSTEEFSVDSLTDLTHLGMSISKSLQAAGSSADVYMDSLNPLLAVLRVDYVINFLQTVAARVKANNGRLCVTVGTGIEERDLTKLEESADCVIETQLQESGGGQRRRLRIKKVRGKPYNDRWTRFRVEEGKGIIFLTYNKTT